MSTAQQYEQAATQRAESLLAQQADKDEALPRLSNASSNASTELSPTTSHTEGEETHIGRRLSVSDYHGSLFKHTNAQYVRSKERLAKQNSRRGRRQAEPEATSTA